MRDVHRLSGPKRYAESLEEAHRLVRIQHPAACWHGSICSYHWAVDGELVAEAWLHQRRPGMWLRIAPKIISLPG